MKIEAGQWWETRNAGRAHIRYVAPENMEYPVFAVLRDGDNACHSETYQINGRYYATTTHSGYDLMTHLPECTGWDWEPSKPVEPGEGWRLLEVGEIIQRNDELHEGGGGWRRVFDCFVGENLASSRTVIRRRIAPDVPADWRLIGGVPGGMLYFKPTEAT